MNLHREDLDQVQLLLSGDRAAFERFFEDYFPRLFRFVLRRADRDVESARDVVQSTLLKAIRNLGAYRGEASLFTWLCQIARHEYSDLRMRQQAADRTVVALENDPSVRAALESLRWAEEAEPPQAIEREQRDELVHATLDYLPSRYAKLLEMKYVEELPVDQIAQRMGMTAIAVQSLLARARAAFREAHEVLASGLADLKTRNGRLKAQESKA